MKTGPDITQSKDEDYTPFAVFALLIVIAVGIFVFVGDQGTGKKGGRSSYLSLGAVARLDNGSKVTFASTSEAAFDELNKAVAAKDNYGWNLLILSGRVLVVQSGTRVRVLKLSAFGATEIRILGGKYAGRRAFIPHEFLKSP